jgi:hypothetical protein
LEDYWRFSQYVAESGLAPKGMEKPASILVALQMGAELGLTPMASLQNIAVINGRPAVWGDSMLAVCRASGVFDEDVFEETIVNEGDKTVARCTVRRLPNGKPVVREFSMGDAKLAGLQGKAGPWTQYPKRMLQMRARSWALRDTFTDALKGVISREEAIDIQQEKTIEGAVVAPAKTLSEAAKQASADLDRMLNASKPPVESPGDEIAADAERHIGEQTPLDIHDGPNLQADWEERVRICKPEEIDIVVRDAMENDGVDVRAAAKDRKAAIAFKLQQSKRK